MSQIEQISYSNIFLEFLSIETHEMFQERVHQLLNEMKFHKSLEEVKALKGIVIN